MHGGAGNRGTNHMYRTTLMSVMAVLSLGTTPSSAQTKTLCMPRNKDLTVWVFRDGKAMSEAMRLLNAKVNDDSLYSPLLSCVVLCGTKVIVTDGGFMHSTVLITEGPKKGCRGYVPNDQLHSE
jgi:hypothetical protein